MNNYIKQLELQNEELQKKLANAQLIQDMVQFTNSITCKKLKISLEAAQDLQFMHDINIEDLMRQYAIDMVEEKIKEKIYSNKV